MGSQGRDDPQGASSAGGTPDWGGFHHVGSRQFSVLGRQEGGSRRGRHDGQELATTGELVGAGPVGQQPEVATAHEVRGHDMEEKAAQEFLGPQFHNLRAPPGGVVLVTKADHAVADEDQPRIGDGHPMGVAAELLQHLFRAAPGRLGVADPGVLLQLAEEGRPHFALSQRGALAGKAEAVVTPQSPHPRQVFTPEDLTEGLDGKQKAGMAGPPLRALGSQPASGHDAVHVDMLGQRLAPGMEHGGNAQFGPQVLRATGKFLEGLGGGLAQEVVERPLVAPDEGIERMGKGKDAVAGGDREQECLLGGQPLGSRCSLALGAVAMATGVISDLLRPARLADLDMPPEGRRAALRNGVQHLLLLVGDVMSGTERCPILSHDVGHLER